MTGRILIVDDDRDLCEVMETDLRLRGFQVSWYTSSSEAFDALRNESYDVVLTDLKMPGMNGIDLCDRIVSNRPDVPVIVMTAFGSLDAAVQAIRAGAYDFVTKPVEMDLLALTLERALKQRALQDKVRILSEAVRQSGRLDEMIGESPPMRDLYGRLSRIADSEATVLVTGESGTGKELAARVLHDRSRRREGPFVAVNCAALPEMLLESELFGHTRGAFTDARSARKGLFLEAEGGTLLLDEIGDFPFNLQAKLLRVLEGRTLRPVGGDRETPFDVRVIATTNRDLESAVEEGRFREDLFFRINVIPIELPPLRERGTDVLLLAQHFIGMFSARSGRSVTGLSETAAAKMLEYGWPGNVRELRNAVERAVALTRYERLAVEDLPEKIRNYRSTNIVIDGTSPAGLVALEEMERRYILHVLDAVGGNKSVAARVLGLDRKTLYRKLRHFNADGGDGD
ncbi:MAG TPA: sigma-54 dependent transcriptional regulator [Syntrophales bacterium]|nr:sigma-54 dependent transcriptional regulator [Syntrophales bacterium]HQN78714.1 sigma-54 dependent transcriptional regulator [Syntrophales bacterium]HQQ26475.1 sigma-54 dependent transcriptional regulator [Syntrophales bacterium]